MDKGFSFHASFTASYNDFTESAPTLRTERTTTIYLWPIGDASQILPFPLHSRTPRTGSHCLEKQ